MNRESKNQNHHHHHLLSLSLFGLPSKLLVTFRSNSYSAKKKKISCVCLEIRCIYHIEKTKTLRSHPLTHKAASWCDSALPVYLLFPDNHSTVQSNLFLYNFLHAHKYNMHHRRVSHEPKRKRDDLKLEESGSFALGYEKQLFQ